MQENYLYSDITSIIIKAYYKVYNKLGYGFLEKVYQNALLLELTALGLQCEAASVVDVFYDKAKIGYYVADIIVNKCVVIEIKAAEYLVDAHEAQLINYLKATNIEVGMLLNFGKIAQFKRKVLTKRWKNLKK